ncbi:phage tail assembly chaperone [Streptococcus sciuri]|uniref:Phage tail assembly chaperone n=1 Tax=Streptococcus sciuri TaxID=2973939 RepID=A0ABT2F7C7_9STRE|nr:phage tail assembly chaperone [Streptococcus sciuri]MCS4488376.1 phage tail assembly chaperone [Streptococcus sciuri]
MADIKTVAIKELAKKPFIIATTNRNMRRMQEFQLSVAKLSDVPDEDYLAQVEAGIALINETIAFLRFILDLDDKQAEILENMDYEETQKIAQKITGRMMGLTEKELEEEQAPKEA